MSITPADGDNQRLPKAVDEQSKITDHYQRDLAAEFAMELTRAETRRFEYHRLDPILEDDENEL